MNGPLIFAFDRGDHVELAVRLLEVLESTAPVVFDEGEAFSYDEPSGTWKKIARELESRTVQAFAGAPTGATADRPSGKPLKVKAGDVDGAIKLAHERAARRGFFAEAPAGIAFQHSFLRVIDGAIYVHPRGEDNRARAGYSFPLREDEPAPRWNRFLAEVFRDDEDRDERIEFLSQFAGAALLGIAPRYQKALVVRGDGSNGKSVLIKILEAAMPPGTTAAIAPQRWAKEYHLAALAGVRLNMVSELPEADILESETIKAIIAGDTTTARHPYGDPFAFRPLAAHLFAANRLPGTDDSGHAFWRRFVVMRFGRKFDLDQDPKLAETIIATELPGVVAWMVRGARRLLELGKYSIPSSSAAEVETWRRDADQVALFLEDETTPPTSDADWTAASILYAAYRRWTERNGHRALSSVKFAHRMATLGRAGKRTNAANVYPVRFRPLEERRSSHEEPRQWS